MQHGNPSGNDGGLLLFASTGVTEGVLSAEGGWPPGQLSWVATGTQIAVEENGLAAYNVPGSASAVQPELPTLDDPYLDRQWALKQIRMTQTSQLAAKNGEVLVAVLDTGVARDHEDLEGRVVASINFTSSPVVGDVYGHGTHIAGIIAANTNNGKGIAGIVPTCQIMNVKVADDRGRTEVEAMADGILWAVKNGASVINVSAEFFEPSPDLEEAIEYAWSHGALVIAAAGNQGNQLPVYPAFYENCVAVAATRQDGSFAPLSNYGDWIDVAAPGFNIYSTLPNNRYGYESGTSFAAAHISGLAVLLFDVVRDTNGDNKVNDEVRAALESTYSIKRLRS